MNNLPPDRHIEPNPLQTPNDYLDVIWRRRGLILGVFGTVLVLAALFTARTRPVYEAAATLMAQPSSQSDILADARTPAWLGMNSSRVANHVELLRSRSMAEEVAGLLDSNAIAQLAPTSARGGRGGRERGPATDLAALVQGSVVIRPVRETDIIQLRASASSPAGAAALANAYLRAYQNYNLEQSRTDVTAIRQFIEDQLSVVHARLDSSERKLEAFKQKSHVVDLDAETKGLITQQSDLAVTWHQAQTEAEGIDAQLTHVRTRIGQDSRNVGGQLENISSPLVSSLKANLDQLEVEKANLFIQGFSESSTRIQNLSRQIVDTRQQLAAEAEKLVDQRNFLDPVSGLKSLYESQLTLETDLAATRAREGVLASAMAGYDGSLSRLPQAEREFAGLSRDVETDRRVYSLLSERYEEARIQEVGRIPAIRTVDSAHGARKVKPNIPANVMLGLILGVALALGAGLGVEYLDTSVHSPRDLERRGFTVLAGIPALTDRKLRLAAGSAVGRVASHLVSSTDTGSSAAEAFRMLRTSLQFAGLDRPLHTIVVTSPGPGEGKSTVATNLATVLAQSGHRTLLLDADLRRPVLHSVFHRRKKPGFTDMVLLGNPDRDAIFPTGIEGLFCLPCGTIPPGPADVLNSSATNALLSRLSADYEYLVIDSPPVLVAADTAILTAKADATILVVRAGKTSTEAIEHARQVLHQAGARVAGFVVNGIKHTGRYGRDSYYYYKYRYTREPSTGKTSAPGPRPVTAEPGPMPAQPLGQSTT
jgi:capsular exopolysaccharide synthesis family protein